MWQRTAKKSVPRRSTAFFYGTCLHHPTPLSTPAPLTAHAVKCRPQFARFFTRTGHSHSLVRPGSTELSTLLPPLLFDPPTRQKNKPCFGRNSSTSRPILPTFHTPKPTSFVPLAPSHTRIRALHRFSTLPSPCRRNPLKTLTNRLLQVKPSPFSPSHPNTDNSLTTNYLQ